MDACTIEAAGRRLANQELIPVEWAPPTNGI